MTSYNQEGYVVDKKGWNLHMSARPDTTCNTAGASGFTVETTGDIPAGAILIPGATLAGSVDISLGAANETLLGVATVSRNQADVRPITYTVLGYVNLIAGTGGVTVGDLLAADTVAAYYGCAITWADVVSSAAASLTAYKGCFGKALTTAAVGGRFLAYVNFLK